MSISSLFLTMMSEFDPIVGDIRFQWITNKERVLNYLLFMNGFVDSVYETKVLNKYVQNFERIVINGSNYIVSNVAPENFKISQWTSKGTKSECVPIYNYIYPNTIKCIFELNDSEYFRINRYMFSYQKHLKSEYIEQYFTKLKSFWGKLKQGDVYIACKEYPIELQAYNPIYPLMSYTLFGKSFLGTNGLKDILLKNVSKWKIKPVRENGVNAIIFQIFNGRRGDLIFSPNAIDKKKAKFSFTPSEEISALKVEKSNGCGFLKVVMYAMKNSSHTHNNHEIIVKKEVSLNYLVGISSRVYKILSKNDKYNKVKKLLLMIKKNRILIIPENEEEEDEYEKD